jgi:AraC-like DNA-binding protein/quercetin dioxygenase-like cupin family protein
MKTVFDSSVLFFVQIGTKRVRLEEQGVEMLFKTANVLWTARYDYEPGWELRPHAHEFYQAMYFVSGEGTLYLKGVYYAVRPSFMFIAPPNAEHGLLARSPLRTLDTKFRVADTQLRKAIGAVYFEAGREFRTLFENIWAEGEKRAPHCREMCSVHLLHMLLLAVRRTEGSTDTSAATPTAELRVRTALTRKALGYITEHFWEDLTVQGLADAIGCSERSIRQNFQESVGESPLSYLTGYRIERAKTMIRDSEHELKEIAGMVGFKSIHHFTRVFHKVTGLSPAAWRKRYAERIREDINIDPDFHNADITLKSRVGASFATPNRHSPLLRQPQRPWTLESQKDR